MLNATTSSWMCCVRREEGASHPLGSLVLSYRGLNVLRLAGEKTKWETYQAWPVSSLSWKQAADWHRGKEIYPWSLKEEEGGGRDREWCDGGKLEELLSVFGGYSPWTFLWKQRQRASLSVLSVPAVSGFHISKAQAQTNTANPSWNQNVQVKGTVKRSRQRHNSTWPEEGTNEGQDNWYPSSSNGSYGRERQSTTSAAARMTAAEDTRTLKTDMLGWTINILY